MSLNNQKPLVYLMLMVLMVFALNACSNFETPQRFVNSPMVLEEKLVQHILPTEVISDGFLTQESEAYIRTGNGPLEVRVTYNPASSQEGVLWARKQAQKMQRHFKKRGVDSVDADILPIKNAQESQTIIRYQAFIAKAPIECEGHDDHINSLDPQTAYIVGCTHKSAMARQIYRSQDLRDNSGDFGANNADRLSQGVDAYRSGLPNQDFEANSTIDQDEQ